MISMADDSAIPSPDPLYQNVIGDEKVVDQDLVTRVVHRAGSPLETVSDRDARISRAAEPTPEPLDPADVAVEYSGIDTRTPEGNLATRSNIVSDGPGTVQEA